MAITARACELMRFEELKKQIWDREIKNDELRILKFLTTGERDMRIENESGELENRELESGRIEIEE